MSKKLLIVFGLAILLAGGVLVWKEKQQGATSLLLLVNNPVESEQEDVVNNTTKNESQFVTNVDPDVSHWQTKETEFFTIKFPKEWYWIESDPKKASDHSVAITNDQNFPVDKYADIHFFPGSDYPISATDLNNSGVVISFRTNPTSNSGTPHESINWEIERIKKHVSSNVDCSEDDTEIGALAMYCTFLGTEVQNKRVQTYFIADNNVTTVVTGWTRDNNVLNRSILKKISQNLIIH